MQHKLIQLIFLSILLFSATTHATVIKIATLTPDGTTSMKKMRSAAKEIATHTNNRVKIKFYPGGVMGNQNSILRKIRINQLQGAIVSSGSLSRYYKDTTIYAMPFFFNSQEEVLFVRKKMDKLIIQGLEKKGFISFGIVETGFTYILSDKPIKEVEFLRKQKLWIPDTASSRNAVKAFKLTPVPLPFSDVLAGLQTSLVNTIIISPIACIALQWHTQVKYLTETPILYGWGTLIIQKQALNKLSKQDKKIVNEIFAKTINEMDIQNQKDNIEALAALKNQGILFIKPDSEQLPVWKKLAQQGNSELVEKNLNSKKMYDLINKHITDYRKIK